MKNPLRRLCARIRFQAAAVRNRYLLQAFLSDPNAASRFRVLSRRYSEISNQVRAHPTRPTDILAPHGSYDWAAWADEISGTFASGLPADFLHTARISATMVYSSLTTTRKRLDRVVGAFGDAAASLVREDSIGNPLIIDRRFLTSANRLHHCVHLAEYLFSMGSSPLAFRRVLEWGGGYGNMARILRRYDRKITYIIVDLPALLAVQYVYLAALHGEHEVNIVTSENPALRECAFNLIDVELVTSNRVTPTCDLFISTWAATECRPSTQALMARTRFFGGPHLLLGYALDSNNLLRTPALEYGGRVRSASLLAEDGHGSHEYCFR